MGRFVYDPALGLIVPGRAEARFPRVLSGSMQQALLMGGGTTATGPTIASANVVALLQFDGSGASFTDSGPNGLTVTAAGAATQTTTTGAFGGGKALVCGANTSDYVGISGNALFALGDYGINFRVQFGSASFASRALLDIAGSTSGVSIRGNQGGSNVLWRALLGASFSYAKTWAANTWYEVEVSRAGANSYVFLDGVQLAAGSFSGTAISGTPALRIGAVLQGGVYNDIGIKVDDVLIANVALHIAAYTPRTAAWTIV